MGIVEKFVVQKIVFVALFLEFPNIQTIALTGLSVFSTSSSIERWSY